MGGGGGGIRPVSFRRALVPPAHLGVVLYSMANHDLAVDELGDFCLDILEVTRIVHVFGSDTGDPSPPLRYPLLWSDESIKDDVTVIVDDRDPS